MERIEQQSQERQSRTQVADGCVSAGSKSSNLLPEMSKRPVLATRLSDQTGIFFVYCDPLGASPFWQHIDMNDQRAARVGPQYRSKEELLVDHEDYLRRAGWMRDEKQTTATTGDLYSRFKAAVDSATALFNELPADTRDQIIDYAREHPCGAGGGYDVSQLLSMAQDALSFIVIKRSNENLPSETHPDPAPTMTQTITLLAAVDGHCSVSNGILTTPDGKAVDLLSTAKSRVLVTVSGGVADYVADEGIDVEIFDHDNYFDDPLKTCGVPAHFKDLAEPVGVPVGNIGKD